MRFMRSAPSSQSRPNGIVYSALQFVAALTFAGFNRIFWIFVFVSVESVIYGVFLGLFELYGLVWICVKSVSLFFRLKIVF